MVRSRLERLARSRFWGGPRERCHRSLRAGHWRAEAPAGMEEGGAYASAPDAKVSSPLIAAGNNNNESAGIR